MGVGSGHTAGCGCAQCAAACNHEETGSDTDRGLALAGYGVPTGGLGDALIGGRTWAEKTISYGFPVAAESYDVSRAMAGIQYGDGEPMQDFAPLNSAQRDAVEAALAQIAAVSGLKFARDDDDAAIRIAQSAAPSSAWAYYPETSAEGGDVWLGSSRGYYDDPQRGDYAWHTILHEIGHAVGLKHGHEHGVIGAGGPLEAHRDSMEWSVMTYRSYLGDRMEGGYSNESAGYAQSLMRVDIAALQQLYGANYDHLSGDTRYAWNPGTGELSIDGDAKGAPAANRVFETIWDGGGEDVIDASAYREGVSINLAPGEGSVLSADQLAYLNRKDASDAAIYADANVYLADLHDGDLRSVIENARGGAGDDSLQGNSVDNKLWGLDGEDRLIGLAGADSLFGGGGADSLAGGGGRDRLIGQGGDDALEGGGGRDHLRGGGGDDDLKGGHGRDKLAGGGGDDHLTGGRGADILIGGGGADVFHFAHGDGADQIRNFQLMRDQIDLSRLGTDFASLDVRDTAQGARISAEGVSIDLLGVDADQLTADLFIF